MDRPTDGLKRVYAPSKGQWKLVQKTVAINVTMKKGRTWWENLDWLKKGKGSRIGILHDYPVGIMHYENEKVYLPKNQKHSLNASSRHHPTKETSSLTSSAVLVRLLLLLKSWDASGLLQTSASSLSTPPANG